MLLETGQPFSTHNKNSLSSQRPRVRPVALLARDRPQSLGLCPASREPGEMEPQDQKEEQWADESPTTPSQQRLKVFLYASLPRTTEGVGVVVVVVVVCMCVCISKPKEIWDQRGLDVRARRVFRDLV